MNRPNNLLKLFAANRRERAGLRIVSNEASGEATVYLYDLIGEWGITPTDFIRELSAVKADTVHLRINSPGGDVFDARTIYTALAQHKAKVVAHVDGVAASAATVIAMAADEIEIAEGAFFMIHNAWAFAIGDKNDMLDMAALLETIDGSIAADYDRRCGKGLDQVRAWMDAETWFTAAEAQEQGFVDRVFTPEKKAESRWNLDAYANAPKVEPPKESPENEPAGPDPAAMRRRLRLMEMMAA